MNRYILDISWLSLWRVLVVVLIASAVYALSNVVAVLLLSLVFSSALDSFVSFLERKRVPRILGTMTAFFLIAAVFASVLYLVLPIAVSEFNNLLGHLSVFSSLFGNLSILDQLSGSIGENLNKLSEFLTKGSVSVFGAAASFLGDVLLFAATLVFTFYLTVSRHGVDEFLRAVLPQAYEDYVLSVVARSRRKIGNWLRAQLFLGFLVGSLVFVSLWLLGVKYALVLGILAGVFEIVPVVGPIFAGSVAFLAAFPESLMLGVYTIIVFVAIQQLESHVFIPLIMRRATGLHPLIILAAMFVGSQLAGFVGLILAVPLSVVAQEIIEDWARRKAQRIV